MVQLTLKLAIIVAFAISASYSRKIQKRIGRVVGDDKVTGEIAHLSVLQQSTS